MDTKRFRERSNYAVPTRGNGSNLRSLDQNSSSGNGNSTFQQSVRPTSVPNDQQGMPAPTPASTNISIQINMPKVHMPKFRLPRLPYKRIGVWMLVILVAITLAMGGYFTVKHLFFKPKPIVSRINAQGDSTLHLSQPSFTPVAPKNKLSLGEGNSRLTAFDGTRDSYSYMDEIGGTPITVSQQPVPSTFTSASEAVQTIAQSMDATDKITTNYSTAYEVFNSKSSTQTVVFSVNDVLVFIVCNFKHTDSQWQNYINNLT